MQQRAIERERGEARAGARRADLEIVLATYWSVFEETNNLFEARRQAKLKHMVFFVTYPEMSNLFDDLTALMWVAGGGEYADAVCYMRGFQFGTAHHDQCVFEVKMEAGRDRTSTDVPPAQLGSHGLAPSPPVVTEYVEQGGKVYESSDCIGPVIMGRCHGQILPNKAYHPTCYGDWLNGQCTGPMF
jgi:hypothetical protein